MEMCLFDLDVSTEAVFLRTSERERKMRRKKQAEIDRLNNLISTLTDTLDRLRAEVLSRHEYIDELQNTIEELQSQEPLKTILSLKEDVDRARKMALDASRSAARANSEAHSAKLASITAESRARSAEYQARKDFWDRL